MVDISGFLNSKLTNFLNYNILNNTILDWIIFIAVFAFVLVITRFFKHRIIVKLEKLAKKTKSEIDDLIIKSINKIGWPVYILVSLYIGLRFITISVLTDTILYYVTVIVVIFYVFKALQEVIGFSIHRIIQKTEKEDKRADTSIIELLGKALCAVLWLIALLLILSIFGVNITALVAGLGIGGIAIAFGLQKILTDIFASFSIFFDKPFQTGDFIVVGSDAGTVKKIGIKSTRLQTLQGEELIISNKELTETRVHNYKKMKKRRVSFDFGVLYETPTNKLKKIPKIVKKVIDKIELADLSRVHFKKLADFSLNFEVVYYINKKDYNKYMDIQQAINFGLKEQFEKAGIKFAYPTQTIFINK